MYLQIKSCPKCKIEKSVTDYYRTSSKCKSCHRKDKVEWMTNNRDKVIAQNRRWAWKKNFGLTEAEYYNMAEDHKHVCAICHRSEDTLLSVDHCHTTGKIRGLLCKKCNLAIGHFDDQIDRLKSAIEYLEKHQEEAGIAPASY